MKSCYLNPGSMLVGDVAKNSLFQHCCANNPQGPFQMTTVQTHLIFGKMNTTRRVEVKWECYSVLNSAFSNGDYQMWSCIQEIDQNLLVLSAWKRENCNWQWKKVDIWNPNQKPIHGSSIFLRSVGYSVRNTLSVCTEEVRVSVVYSGVLRSYW